MANLKIVLLGSGSLYFTRVLSDLITTGDLQGAEITLYDIDARKSELMAGLARRLLDQTGGSFTVRSMASFADALDGARFVLSSIGGSGAEVSPNVYNSYYHGRDVAIPARYRIYQVVGDAAGPAGMMMGLRAVPQYLALCREMERRCPEVLLLNHSNPMAVLCRAMRKYSRIRVVGICHGVQIGICHAAKLLEVEPDELECRWIGTNHYYWFTSVRHRGVNMHAELLRRTGEQRDAHGARLSARLSLVYGRQIVYPEDDHLWEFYPFAAAVGGYEALPYNLRAAADHFGGAAGHPVPNRAKHTEAAREQFFSRYQELLDATAIPMTRERGVRGEGIGDLISAIAHGRREIAIVNIPNDGVVPNLSREAIMELEGVTDSSDVRGIHGDEAPTALRGLHEKRFAWQELVADAAAKGDRRLAMQALLLDEMAILPERAESMLAELLEASCDLLPQFFGEGPRECLSEQVSRAAPRQLTP
jgi:alpha-galactosidase